MVNTFQEEYANEIAETVYVSANPWVNRVLIPDVDYSDWMVLRDSYLHQHNLLDRVLQQSTASEEDSANLIVQSKKDINGIEAYPAEELTEYGIQAGREHDPERMIVHYMQPHASYIHRAVKGETPTKIEKSPWQCLRDGCEKTEVWEAYLGNLRYVLDNVSTLVNNYDGDTVITADHGELLGKWGLLAHGSGIPHPKLRVVPWVRTTATDNETVIPDHDLTSEPDADVEDRLAALGYK